MKKELKDRWVAALRSGEYEQVVGALNKSEGYCCLGVACHLFAKEAGVEVKSDPWKSGSHLYDDFCDVLPPKLQRYLELDDTGTLPSPVKDDTDEDSDGHFDLVSLNDEARFTFSQIADVIEEQF